MNIFLTGASGFVGSHLLKRLTADGHHVMCHVRLRLPEEFMQMKGLVAWEGDLNNVSALSNAIQGIDSIIHCAAETSLWNSAELLIASNVIMTQRMIQAAKQANVKQFIYMSDASVAKDRRISTLNVSESTPLPNIAGLPYIQSKSMAEQFVMNSGDESLRTICLRPTFIWGRGDMIDKGLGQAANLKKFGWFSQGEYPFSTCYIENLCEAVHKALLSSISKETFFISDGLTLNLREWMAQRLKVGGFSVPTLSIPRSMAWPLARFTENGWRYLPLKGDPPLTREMVHIMAYPFSVSIDKAKAMLAYEPIYSIEEGLLQMAKSHSF